jgi:hypothetical protein
VRESGRPTAAKKQVIPPYGMERRGPESKHAESEGGNSAWTQIPLRRTGRNVGEQFSSRKAGSRLGRPAKAAFRLTYCRAARVCVRAGCGRSERPA